MDLKFIVDTCLTKKWRVFLYLTGIIILCTSNASGQQTKIQWQFTLGSWYYDQLHSCKQVSDGFIIGGFSYTTPADSSEALEHYDEEDYYVMKLDADRKFQWHRRYGGRYNDRLSVLEPTSDGGYILGGNSNSIISGVKSQESKNWDYWIIKIDSKGDIQWETTIGGQLYEDLTSIQELSNGDYVIGGSSNSFYDRTYRYYLIKLSPGGSILWEKGYSGSKDDNMEVVRETSEGGIIMGGTSVSPAAGIRSESKGRRDIWLIKLNKYGYREWEKSIGSIGWDYFKDLQITNDGGFILAGSSNSDSSADKSENVRGGYDYWVIKTDALANIEWEKTIGGSDYDRLNKIEITEDGGYILGGESSSSKSAEKTEDTFGKKDLWMVKLNRDGDIEWDKTIGGDEDDILTSLEQTTDGCYLIGGYSSSSVSGNKTTENIGYSDFWVVSLCSDVTTSNHIQICEGESFVLPGGKIVREAGLYVDTLTSMVGLDSVISTTLDIVSFDLHVNFSKEDTLFSASEPGAKFQWVNCDSNAPLVGDTLAYFKPAIEGNYAVVVKKNDCSKISSCYNVTFEDDPVVTGFVQKSKNIIRLFPNPAKAEVEIISKNDRTLKLYLFDVQGKLLLSKSFQGRTTSLDINDLSKGVYIIKVYDVDSLNIFRLAKE